MDTSEQLNGTELKAEEQFSWAPLLWGTHLAGTQEKLLLPALSQLGSACLGLLVTGTLSASCSAPGSLHHEPENYPGLGPCDRLTWSRPLRPAPGTPGAPQQPRLVAPASPASRPEAAEGPAESLPEAHTRRRGSPDCGHGDPGPRAGSALRPARWASGLAVGRQRLHSAQGCSLICKRLPVCKASGRGGSLGTRGHVRSRGLRAPHSSPELPHQSLLYASFLFLFLSFE